MSIPSVGVAVVACLVASELGVSAGCVVGPFRHASLSSPVKLPRISSHLQIILLTLLLWTLTRPELLEHLRDHAEERNMTKNQTEKGKKNVILKKYTPNYESLRPAPPLLRCWQQLERMMEPHAVVIRPKMREDTNQRRPALNNNERRTFFKVQEDHKVQTRTGCVPGCVCIAPHLCTHALAN